MKKESKKNIKKQAINQEKVLAIVFVALSILVIILLIIALKQKNARQVKDESHITIPVLEENTKSNISINLKEFKEEDTNEYVFIVSNYREDKINKNELEYDLKITNSDNIEIKLYKNENTTNLIEKELEVEDNTLIKNKKQEDVYKLVITKNDKIKDTSVINIEIDS